MPHNLIPCHESTGPSQKFQIAPSQFQTPNIMWVQKVAHIKLTGGAPFPECSDYLSKLKIIPFFYTPTFSFETYI
jgi:hypothetical protein